MRILMLSWEYPPHSVGGLAPHVEGLSEALSSNGNEVHVITLKTEDSLEEEKLNNVWVHRVIPPPVNAPDFATWVLQLNMSMLQSGFSLLSGQHRFHVIHAHDWLAAHPGKVLKHAFKIPLVATIHATEAGRNHGLHTDMQRYINSVEWMLCYEAWRVIVCSRYMEQDVCGLFQLPRDKVSVIPNGVKETGLNVGSLDLSFRSRYAHPDEKIVFFIGRLVPEKGVEVLLQAVPGILKRVPEVKFVIAGKGPMEGYLKYLSRARGNSEKVYFTGYIDDPTRNKLYSCSQVAVFPSLYEPFGIVALEAMACGIPVVVTDTGGLAEIVHHGVNGLKAYPGDYGSLEQQVVRALRDEGLARSMTIAAKEEVASKYTWRAIAGRTEDVYRQVAGEHRKSRWGNRNLLTMVKRSGSASRKKENVSANVASGNYSWIQQRLTGLGDFREGRGDFEGNNYGRG